MVSGDGIFRLESDTSCTAAGGTLYQWQDNQWVLVGYHSKKLPEPVQNYRVTELELTGLLLFMCLSRNSEIIILK